MAIKAQKRRILYIPKWDRIFKENGNEKWKQKDIRYGGIISRYEDRSPIAEKTYLTYGGLADSDADFFEYRALVRVNLDADYWE